ncbi:MAG: hypothetical protein DME24_15580 [Verrucomicrobia bacterium]|nr:MAG: hypothetical protein DME24_15580 [Verrucomicrobiota bacterium]
MTGLWFIVVRSARFQNVRPRNLSVAAGSKPLARLRSRLLASPKNRPQRDKTQQAERLAVS